MSEMQVDCIYRNFDWPGFGSLYTCNIDSSVNQRCAVESFKGVHLQGKTDTDVLAISFDDIAVAYLPSGITKFFPRLRILEVANCGLRRITAKDLIGFDHLEALFFMDNHLKSLPNDLLVGVPKIKSLCFFNNRLEHLSSALLSPIPDKQLTYVDFRKNTRINALFSIKNIQGEKSVKKLKNLIDSSCIPPNDIDDKRVEDAQTKLSSGFKELWHEIEFADFSFVVRDARIPVHKCVLAIRLPSFKNFMRYDERVKMTQEFKVKNYRAEAVEDFLHCLYTGEIANDDNALEVYKLAIMFDVTKIQDFCEALLIRDMNSSTAIEAFKIGARYELDELFDAAFNEIKKMFPDIKFHDALKKQPQTVMLMIETKFHFDAKDVKVLNISMD